MLRTIRGDVQGLGLPSGASISGRVGSSFKLGHETSFSRVFSISDNVTHLRWVSCRGFKWRGGVEWGEAEGLVPFSSYSPSPWDRVAPFQDARLLIVFCCCWIILLMRLSLSKCENQREFWKLTKGFDCRAISVRALYTDFPESVVNISVNSLWCSFGVTFIDLVAFIVGVYSYDDWRFFFFFEFYWFRNFCVAWFDIRLSLICLM